MDLEIKKKKRLNFCLLKNFETKMTNLVSDLFLLLSVPSHINSTGMLVRKLEFKSLVKENNMDILCQARLRLYSVTH